MDVEDRDKTSKVLAIIGTVSMLLFLYMITCFFRRDWIRYDDVERAWQVETMMCEDQVPLQVIHLYKTLASEPGTPIRFSKSMFDHLKQQKNQNLPVHRKLVGYIQEWDYGLIVPITIAGKYVDESSLIPELNALECHFSAMLSNQQESRDTRRKMR